MCHILCLTFLKTLHIYLLNSMFIFLTQGFDLFFFPSPMGGELILSVGSNLTLGCMFNSSDIVFDDMLFNRDGTGLDAEFEQKLTGSLDRRRDGFSKTLLITKTNVSCSDGGTYRCNVGELSKSINVTIVQVTTKDFTMSDPNKHGTLSCRPEICSPVNDWSSSSHFKFRVTWLFKDKEIGSNDALYNISQETDELLITSRDTYGIYTCKGDVQRRDLQESESLHWMTKVYLKVPPSLSNVDPERSVCLNDHLTLNCEAAGFPPPILEWRKNGSDMETNSTRIYVLSGGLHIQSFTANDTGKYTCIAKSDEFSTTTERADIQVILKSASECVGDSNNSLAIWISIGVISFLVLLVIFITICIKKRQGERRKNLGAQHEYDSVKIKAKKHKKKKRHEPEALYDVVDVTVKRFETDPNDIKR